jgi:hypothetical protein
MSTGIAIALAWPETICKQAGAWYDGLMELLGISKNNYYKVGHAALVLIDVKSGTCHYFDFGRYHAPYGHGRVRNQLSDFDVTLAIKAEINQKDEIVNYDSILNELLKKAACHGDGSIHASYCSIDFDTSFGKAMEMHNQSPIKYGPFVWSGTNCSRFVRTVILAGRPRLHSFLKLMLQYSISPTPIGNVLALQHKTILKSSTQFKLGSIKNLQLKCTLQEPTKHALIPKDSKWLAGEGAGSWFNFHKTDKNIEVVRFNMEGIVECKSMYGDPANDAFNLNEAYEIIHPSYCNVVTIKQNGAIITLKNYKIK